MSQLTQGEWIFWAGCLLVALGVIFCIGRSFWLQHETDRIANVFDETYHKEP